MATQKNFVVKNGLNVGTVEVINSSGEITSAALGSSNTEATQDIVGAMVVGGTNITATYDDSAGSLTIDADLTGDIEGVTAGDGLTGGGSSGTPTVNVGAGTGISVAADSVSVDMTAFDTDNLSEGSSNLYHTSERVQDVVGGQLVTNGSHTGISFAYDDANDGAIDATVSLSGFNTDNLSEGSSNLYHTSERVDDRVAAFLTAGTGITLTHDDAGNSLTIAGAAQYGDSDVLSYLSGGTFAGSILPSADVTYDLGSSSKQWRDVYVGPGSLYVNGQQVVSDNSGTITVSADSDQNVSVQTSGSGDIELDATGTGNIQIKAPMQIQASNAISSSDGNAIEFSNSIDVNAIESRSTDTNLTLTANGTGVVTVNDSLNVTGDLTVSGTTTTVNSETISLADNIIALNSNFTSGSPTEDTGISVTRGGSASKTLLWDETNDKWSVGSETFVAGTFEGALTGNVTGTVSGNAGSATALETARSIGLGGDLSGSASFDGTGDITITATIGANSVALGTDTTGNFVGGIAGTTNEIEVSGSGSENATVTIGLPNNVTISGTSTLTGKATTGFTTIGSSDGALRNTFIHSAAPTAGDGAVGDVWIVYA